MDFATLFIVLPIFIHGISGNHPLKHRLKTWETITGDDITIHRQRRSVDGKYSTIDKQVSFNAFQKQFTLSLITSPGIFSPDFRAIAETKDGPREVNLDKASMYQGTVLGEPGSIVHAHLQGRDLMASIKMKEDTYVVEPSWRHLSEDMENLNDDGTSDSKMIVYRQSDLNMTRLRQHKNDSFCQITEIMNEIRKNQQKQKNLDPKSIKEKDRQAEVLHRHKRATGKRGKVCTLALVADHHFYTHMGNGKTLQTMYYLINLIERVNHIFKTTNWGSEEEGNDVYKGYGFQISSIVVHETDGPPRYNSDNERTAKGLLELFSRKNHSQCLAHLFTYVDFDNGVLGLAYVGASKKDAVGGICTKSYEQGTLKPTLYLNTGLTTAKNWGQRILTLEADLVTTHELGHNFGAEHDNGEVKECSPGESNDGNYIMYPAAVSGEDANNNKFSSCSKHNVLPVLKYKAPECFQEDKEFFCGNFRVEEGEQCDAGYLQDDVCCDSKCKLKKGKFCSSKNSVCCVNCQTAPNTTLCYAEVPDSCLADTYCDGKSLTCPEHLHKPDNTTCGDKGKCLQGKCLPFCNTVGMKPCLCQDDKENLCKRCCAPVDADGVVGKCDLYTYGNGSVPELRNSARCSLGYCKNGECIKQTQDVIERVWQIFEFIAPDKIGEFLADNIVGAVLVFSLLFWVPCGCLINFVDKRRMEQRRKDDELFAERISDIYKFTPNPNGGGMFGSSNALHKIQRNNAAKAGLAAKEQWVAARERGLATRKSEEKLDVSNGQNSTSHDDYNGRGDSIIKVGAANTNHNAQPQHNDVEMDDVTSVAVRRISRPQLLRQNRTTDDATA